MSKATVPATGGTDGMTSLPPDGIPSLPEENASANMPVSMTRALTARPLRPLPATSAEAPLPVQVPGAKPRFSKSIAAPGGAPRVATVTGKSPTVTSSPATALSKPAPRPAQPLVQEKELAIEDAVFEMANRMRAAAKAQASAADPKSSIKQGKDAKLSNDAAEPASVDERPAQPEQTMNTNPSTINMEGDSGPDAELAPKHETEIVLGRRQLASVAFVVVVFLGIVAMLSYLIGRASSDATVPAAPAAIADASEAEGSAAQGDAEQAEAAGEDVPTPPESAASTEAVTSAPIFGNPAAGDRYLQVGSVTTGVATLMVQGLRTEGLPAIATNSASGQDHKVLVGPLNSDAEMSRASQKLNEMKLQWFVRN